MGDGPGGRELAGVAMAIDLKPVGLGHLAAESPSDGYSR